MYGDCLDQNSENEGAFEMTEFAKIFVVPIMVVVLFSGIVAQQPVVSPKSDADKWLEDVEFLRVELPKRHKNLFFRMSRTEFETAISELKSKLPTLSRNQTAMEIARIVAMVGDGHTSFFPMFSQELKFRSFPLRFYWFRDGMYVRNTPPGSVELLGSRLTGVGRFSLEQAIEKLTPYIPHENVMWVREFAPFYLSCPEVLEALGLSPTSEESEFRFEKDGKTMTVKLKPAGVMGDLFRPDGMKDWIDANRTASQPTPLYLRDPAVPLRFEDDPKTRIFYVRMDQIAGMQGKSMAQFWTETGAAAKLSSADKFVLDLRANGGGNNELVAPVIRGLIQLEKFDRKGNLFVLIGRRTFSAAQNLVNAIEIYTNAVFVGEPTGNRVNMYGDARPFNLPNSGLRIQASTRWHQNMSELDMRSWRTPNVAAAMTFAAYKDNLDPAIDAVLNYKPAPSVQELVGADFFAGKMDVVKSKLVAFMNDPVNEYADLEGEINSAGYFFLRQRQFDPAIRMFTLNTELHPRSANSFDSLGEALEAAGKKEEAIKAYESALRIDPNYQSSVRALARLKAN